MLPAISFLLLPVLFQPLCEGEICIMWGIHKKKFKIARSCNFITWPLFLLTPSFSLPLQDPSIPCTTAKRSTVQYFWSYEQGSFQRKISGDVVNIEDHLLSPSTLLLSAASACSLLLSAWWRMIRSFKCKTGWYEKEQAFRVLLPHFRAVYLTLLKMYNQSTSALIKFYFTLTHCFIDTKSLFLPMIALCQWSRKPSHNLTGSNYLLLLKSSQSILTNMTQDHKACKIHAKGNQWKNSYFNIYVFHRTICYF